MTPEAHHRQHGEITPMGSPAHTTAPATPASRYSDLHVWTLTSGKEALSAHVLVDDLADGQHILLDLQHLLRERFGIEHTTIQLETHRSPLVQIDRSEGNPG